MRNEVLFLLLGILYMFGIQQVDASTYNTALFKGIAPLEIDGDISDWSLFNVSSEKIESKIISESAENIRYGGAQDLSASFSVLADNHNLYIAIKVRDDIRVFERTNFGEYWWDDAVQIYLDNGSIIDITKNNLGEVVAEGYIAIGNEKLRVPYMWETVGVQASLLERKDGYNVEVMIPQNILSDQKIDINSSFGLNITVSDHDAAGRRDNVVGWIITSSKVKAEGEIIIGTELVGEKMDEIRQVATQHFRHPNAKPASTNFFPSSFDHIGERFVISLEEPTNVQIFTFSEFSRMNTGTLEGRFAQLLAQESQSHLATSMGGILAFIYYKEGRHSQALRVYHKLEENASSYIKEWATHQKQGLLTWLQKLTHRTHHPEGLLAVWNQIHAFSTQTSDSQMQIQTLETLIFIHETLGGQAQANALRRKAIEVASLIIGSEAFDVNVQNALRTRFIQRLKLGEEKDGFEELEQSITRFSSPEQVAKIFAVKAESYHEIQNYTKAVEVYQALLSRATTEYEFVLAKKGLAETFLEMRDVPSAKDMYEEILRDYYYLKDNFAVRDVLISSYIGLAQIYNTLGNKSQAIDYLKKSTKIFPPVPPKSSRQKIIFDKP